MNGGVYLLNKSIIKKLRAEEKSLEKDIMEHQINFKKLKSEGFENKFQKTAFHYKRKILKMEYKSILKE